MILSIGAVSAIYTSNIYLVRGNWNRLSDVNTLVDVGSDPAMLDSLEGVSTGVGKRKVEQVIITHHHSDHTANLPLVKQRYCPVVYAWSPFLPGVDAALQDGLELKVGDTVYRVIHMPGHSEDSVCLYGERDGVLFVGDSPVVIRSHGGTYQPQFVRVLEHLCSLKLNAIYFGHGPPLVSDIDRVMQQSLLFARAGVRDE